MYNAGLAQGTDHFQFIKSTDRKSLHAQIKALVVKAQEVAAGELRERSQRLKDMLDNEDKDYEEEFANKVRSRIDEDISARKAHLHAIKEEHNKRHKRFLDAKRVQQVMESSYEIREALRLEDLKNTKICQEEQILDNQRKKQKECELENYWRTLNQRRWDEFDRLEKYELCKREQMREQMCHVLKLQMEEGEEKRRKEREEKDEEARELNKILDELRLEKFDGEHKPASRERLKYRNELLAEIARRKRERDAEWLAAKEDHMAFIRETQRLEAEAKAYIENSKRDLNRATHQYIAYVRRMRALELGIEKMMDDRTADLHHVDICTKSNIAEMARLKGEEAARCHAILKQQICEEAERRMRWEAEVHENKIIENRFVHPPVTKEMILEKYRQNRHDLDAQIAELRRIRAEEEKRFEQRLQKAIDDPAICSQLAIEYIRDGTDYLAPHPNWKIYGCPRNKYVQKPPMTMEEFDKRVKEASVDKCPCPDAARCHCGFMALQDTTKKNVPNTTKKNVPKVCTQEVHLDVPPEGCNPRIKRDEFKNCPCLPSQRGHANLHHKNPH
ncbi:trichohyalin [Scaptodrosophila lebanonensis]|uniref:Trichohyalin n=1 Tax=Drosophila lebanonensis TaxID=7225 RepID=A0A6J2U7M7_DROLE|nr:trichohyalin [Scaptodrosophila lebanonensis]